MQYRIKNLHDAAGRMIKAKNFNYPPYDRDSKRNDLILSRLFNDTMSGTIKGFYLVSDEDFKAYHRSPKEDNKIQLSAGFYRDGELIPCYDVQLEDAAAMIKEGYTSGIYKIIA